MGCHYVLLYQQRYQNVTNNFCFCSKDRRYSPNILPAWQSLNDTNNNNKPYRSNPMLLDGLKMCILIIFIAFHNKLKTIIHARFFYFYFIFTFIFINFYFSPKIWMIELHFFIIKLLLFTLWFFSFSSLYCFRFKFFLHFLLIYN